MMTPRLSAARLNGGPQRTADYELRNYRAHASEAVGLARGITTALTHKQHYDDFLTKSQTDYQKAFKALTLEGQTFFGLSSYVVSAKAIDRVIGYFGQEAARGPTMANDIFINRLVLERKLRAGYLFPFLTALRLERAMQMTVTGRSADKYTMVTLGSNLIRYSFYVENDLPGYAIPLLDRALAECVTRPRDAHQEFINRAMEYVVMIDEPK